VLAQCAQESRHQGQRHGEHANGHGFTRKVMPLCVSSGHGDQISRTPRTGRTEEEGSEAELPRRAEQQAVREDGKSRHADLRRERGFGATERVVHVGASAYISTSVRDFIASSWLLGHALVSVPKKIGQPHSCGTMPQEVLAHSRVFMQKRVLEHLLLLFMSTLQPEVLCMLLQVHALQLSLVCGGQPSPHRPRLVVSHSTCPPLSSSPHAHSFVIGTVVINTHTTTHCA
jgi:hypothetical protein